MQINAKELNEALHEIPAMITILKDLEERAANIREILIRAIEHKDKNDTQEA